MELLCECREGDRRLMARKSKFSGLFDARTSQGAEGEKRGRGRPSGDAGGKRDNKAEYTQASAYVRRETHRTVKSMLALEGKEFSELVEELLSDWIKSRS
jgi:ribosomal protein L19E